MTTKHLVLLVEDDPETAVAVGDILDSLNYRHVHAPTAEEARRILADEQVCTAIVDLQMRASANSIRAHPETGLTLLEDIRRVYPRRDERDKHLFQVIAMSGVANDREYTVRVMRFADDFIAKPFNENPLPLGDYIRRCFRHSKREDHDHCARQNHKAKAPLREPAPPSDRPIPLREPSVVPVDLAISGTVTAQRWEILLGGQVRRLRRSSLALLLQLIRGREGHPDGWVSKSALHQDAPGANGITRLRDDLGDATLVESSGDSSFRLAPRVRVATVNPAAWALVR